MDACSYHGFGRIYPVFRQQFLLGDQIERGEKDRPSAAGSRANLTGELKWTPEQANGAGDISLSNCVADGSARNHPPFNFDRRDDFNVETVLFSEISEQSYVPRAAMTKTEIWADKNGRDMQALDKNPLDEFLWREQG